MTETITALTDLETVELSLVKRGANRKRIAYAKSEEGMEQMEEIVKAVLELELDNEKAVTAAFKKAELSEKGQEAVRGALRMFSAFKDELPKDVMKMFADLSGNELPVEKALHDPEEDAKRKKKEEEARRLAKKKNAAPFKKEDGTLDLSSVPWMVTRALISAS